MVLFMPMSREDHENLLGELLNPELPQSDRTEILQKLRVDYGTVLADFDDTSKKLDKLTTDNQDLTLANSKLFRQIGIPKGSDEEKKEDQKEFSETITLEQIERGY
jgi:regulator of replication initiation timing